MEPQARQFLTTKQAMNLSGFSRSYLYRLSTQGRLRAFKPGNGQLRFLRTDIENFLTGSMKGSNDDQ